MKKQFVVLAVLTFAISLSAFACPADGKHEPPKPFDPKTAADLVDPKTLTPVETRLNAIIIPELDFRCANLFDIVAFYDDCIRKHGGDAEKNDGSRIRLVCDKTGFGKDIPLIHFSSLNMPLLYALRLSCALGEVKYQIQENTVTVYKPKKADGPTTDSTFQLKARLQLKSESRRSAG